MLKTRPAILVALTVPSSGLFPTFLKESMIDLFWLPFPSFGTFFLQDATEVLFGDVDLY